MRDERFEVSCDVERRGYIASAPELRQPVTALSLGGLRQAGLEVHRRIDASPWAVCRHGGGARRGGGMRKSPART